MWHGCVVNPIWKSHLGEAGTDERLILRHFILVVYFMTLSVIQIVQSRKLWRLVNLKGVERNVPELTEFRLQVLRKTTN
jgi:hypothetical protein